MMEAHLAPTQPTHVNKITTACEICSSPHDTQYCMKDPEQAFVKYASSRTDEAREGLVSNFMASQDARLSKFEADFKQQQSEMTNKIDILKLTKVIKREFKKLEDLDDEDVSLTCGTSLEVFNNEFNRMSGMVMIYSHMKLKLLTSHVTQTWMMIQSNECRMKLMMIRDMIYLMLHLLNGCGQKILTTKSIDHYRKKALWIYWIRGDDEVELTDKEFSDNEDETYLLRTLRDSRLMKNIRMIGSMMDIKMLYQWVDEKPWTNVGVWTEATPVKHYCKPFNYKNGCSEWPTCSLENDLITVLEETYLVLILVGKLASITRLNWYEALKDNELKEKALRNKAIMKGLISDDESCNDGWRNEDGKQIEITFTITMK
ncbi:hypothetical protein Tco_0099257 [Tanacetum coccineum]